MRTYRRLAASTSLLLLLSLAVGGPASAATRGVSQVDFSFSPSTITIAVGDTVVWTNKAATTPHTTTSNTGLWDSGTMNPGASFSHTFNSTGTFPYHCTFHQNLGMVGTVIVQSAGGGGQQTLPATGASPWTLPFAWLGLLFLITGGAILLALRRRRA
ncbi:MAG: hypothetical protein E6G44_06190 [Actinobacteria bacterium]|nr:MAG: hypothetical protein E6G44_06190 [Actinomycetota bacterium]